MNDYTHISIVLDRSGSMASIQQDMQGGLDTFLDGQEKLPGKATVSAYLFDDRYEKTVDMVKLADRPRIELDPRGSTALHDALCKAIDATGRQLADLAEADRPDTVIVLVITDGHENASREFSGSDVKERIERQRGTYNWDFVFLGANQDAVATGEKLGFLRSSSMTYAASAKGVQNTNTALRSYVTNSRTYGAGSSSFSDEDRKAASES
jgi:uncharacterized protein YegL